MNVVLLVCGVLLVLAAIGTIFRLAKGPTLLDRVIASDVLLAIVGAGLSVDMVARDSYENITMLIVISLVGFLGSVTVARFANNKRERQDERASRVGSSESTSPARPARPRRLSPSETNGSRRQRGER